MTPPQADATLRILLVTGGHPFEREPFLAVFEAMEEVAFEHAEQPDAQKLFRPELADRFDATVLYDMPGIAFGPEGPRFDDPPKAYAEGLLALLERGHGFVFLHHAIAGWPAWPEYAEIVGGRFLYLPGELRGRALPDSGYRHGVRHRVMPVGPHPVLEGLEDGFEIEDELYLFCPFESDILPLLRSDYRFEAENFYSAAQAVVHGRMFSNEGWSHPSGSDLIAWTHRYRNSPVVTIVSGDGPSAYASPHFRRLLDNAIHWVAGSVSPPRPGGAP